MLNIKYYGWFEMLHLSQSNFTVAVLFSRVSNNHAALLLCIVQLRPPLCLWLYLPHSVFAFILVLYPLFIPLLIFIKNVFHFQFYLPSGFRMLEQPKAGSLTFPPKRQLVFDFLDVIVTFTLSLILSFFINKFQVGSVFLS